jgi:uncharacterized protein (TIGR02118 family)
MFKRVTILRWREDLDRRQALDRWRNRHAELVSAVPGVVRYVQRPAAFGAAVGSEPELLGIGEVWFHTRADAESATSSEAWDAVIEDARGFAALPPVSVCWVEE